MICAMMTQAVRDKATVTLEYWRTSERYQVLYVVLMQA
ncbi:unnamed protein product [Chrysoparadoxa australica]